MLLLAPCGFVLQSGVGSTVVFNTFLLLFCRKGSHYWVMTCVLGITFATPRPPRGPDISSAGAMDAPRSMV